MFEMYIYDPETIVPRDPWDARAPSLTRPVRVRIVDREQRRKFVREHRTCVFGYARKDHGPAMTALSYVMDGDDELSVSTMAARATTFETPPRHVWKMSDVARSRTSPARPCPGRCPEGSPAI